MLVGAILGLFGYLWLLFVVSFEAAVIIIMVILVGAICVILGWVGYTLITTPAPAPPTAPPTPVETEKTSKET